MSVTVTSSSMESQPLTSAVLISGECPPPSA